MLEMGCSMSLVILRFMLVLGIAGHALNMYCDRILSVFPNGRLMLKDIKDIGKEGKMAKLLEGVSEKVPMRSAILGAFAVMLQFFGYFSITAYIYGQSKVFGSIMFAAIVIFVSIGIAHHVKYGLTEYVFIKLGRDEKAKALMLDMFNSAPITRICYVGYLIYIFTLMAAIVSGVAAVPVWAVIFTVLPVFIVLAPLRIIGTLHIAGMVTMLAWIFLI